jgi:hypothetical protein
VDGSRRPADLWRIVIAVETVNSAAFNQSAGTDFAREGGTHG